MNSLSRCAGEGWGEGVGRSVQRMGEANIAGARLPIQVDIGFGDAVTPSPQEVDYPSTLDMPPARLLAYPPPSAVAEKWSPSESPTAV